MLQHVIDDGYPVSVVLTVVLPLGHREQVEELGVEIQSLLPAGLLPQVHHQVAGDQYCNAQENIIFNPES